MSCRPIGSPAVDASMDEKLQLVHSSPDMGSCLAGTDIAGTPARLAGTVMLSDAYAHAAGSWAASESSGATVAAVAKLSHSRRRPANGAYLSES